jgi:hypothetical protein
MVAFTITPSRAAARLNSGVRQQQTMLRPISKLEAALVLRTLEVGATTDISPELVASVGSLQVTALCKCGCSTVWFGPDGDGSNGRIVAEAFATSAGEDIQLIVWERDGAFVGLELVGQGATPLPDLESVRPWDVA